MKAVGVCEAPHCVSMALHQRPYCLYHRHYEPRTVTQWLQALGSSLTSRSPHLSCFMCRLRTGRR